MSQLDIEMDTQLLVHRDGYPVQVTFSNDGFFAPQVRLKDDFIVEDTDVATSDEFVDLFFALALGATSASIEFNLDDTSVVRVNRSLD